MKAIRAFYDRAEYPDGTIVEMSIWIVPGSVPGGSHAFKYSLYYGYPGRRVVGYDNEREKGYHRHVGDREESYRFSSLEALIADFLSDVKQARGAR